MGLREERWYLDSDQNEKAVTEVPQATLEVEL